MILNEAIVFAVSHRGVNRMVLAKSVDWLES